MVKVLLHLGWLVAFLVALSPARPHVELALSGADDDPAARSERSTNLSHITGTARKVQMYVKNRYLQVLPDGSVNGTGDDGSDYTILQRQSVKTGQLLVQGVATCLFLCMDSCGLLYGSRNFTGDCVFNETFEQHRYNKYSSSKYSNERRTLYVALNKRGGSRKVQVPRRAPLGKLSSYAMVLLHPVSEERVRDLADRILRVREQLRKGTDVGSLAGMAQAQHPLRHHGFHHLCPQLHPTRLAQGAAAEPDDTDETGRDRFRCRRRKKRKKKKRRCREGEQEGEQCQGVKAGGKRKKKCQQGEGEQECQQRLEAAKRRRKSRNGDKKLRDDKKPNKNPNKKKQKQKQKKKKFTSDGDSDNARTENQRDVVAMTTTGGATFATPRTTPQSSNATISTTNPIVSATSSSTLPCSTNISIASDVESQSTTTASEMVAVTRPDPSTIPADRPHSLTASDVTGDGSRSSTISDIVPQDRLRSSALSDIAAGDKTRSSTTPDIVAGDRDVVLGKSRRSSTISSIVEGDKSRSSTMPDIVGGNRPHSSTLLDIIAGDRFRSSTMSDIAATDRPRSSTMSDVIVEALESRSSTISDTKVKAGSSTWRDARASESSSTTIGTSK